MFLPDIGLGVGAHSVWEDLLPRLSAYNVDVVTSAGNDGPQAFVSKTSPQIDRGPDSKLIIVGATDASGFPIDATQFAPPRLALIDIYAIGQDVLVPWAEADLDVPGQSNRFATVSSTSFAAPIVAGLLSMLIARQDVTGTVNNRVKAKDVLRNQAVNLKGRDWPNIEGYFIPRAATPWGPIACPQPARPIKTMTSFSLQNVPTNVPDIAASAVTLNFASYTVARPVSYVFSILIRPMMPL
jgi:subtilisin family serine protease